MRLLLYLWMTWMVVAPVSVDADDRPNIIFFLTDDQRFDQMGCAGHEILRTPNMDRLASRGVRFEHAFVTTPICAASRASLLTGTPERTHGYTFGKPPVPQRLCDTSYPTVLRNAGYRTGFIGKFGMRVPDGAIGQMFDVFRAVGRGPYFRRMPDGSTRHETDLIADHAISFLQTHDDAHPFCLSLSFNAPHAEDGDKRDHYPWPPSANGMYEQEDPMPPPRLGDPAIFESQPDFLRASMNRDRWFWRWDTSEKYDRNLRGYYRMISGIDHAMERVLRELESRGLADNTVIIFSSDNGYYLGDRGFAGKWSHYEQSLRVPLIIMDPRVERTGEAVSSAMALNLDIAATIIDLAGQPVPETHEGASLVPFVEGTTPATWRTSFRCEHLMHHASIPKWYGVRGSRYVYARYFEQDPVYEFLHDLESDPDQHVNLASDAAHREILDRMRAMVPE